jgi:hypothetical protein
MCTPEWEIVRLTNQSVGAKLADGTIVDLQAAHVKAHGSPSPHFRDSVSFRLAASYGVDLVRELIARGRRGNA